MHSPKDKVFCAIYTGGHRIDGEVHVLTGSRLTDALNSKANDFIAITDAIITDSASGLELTRSSYVAVNRLSISLVVPIDAPAS